MNVLAVLYDTFNFSQSDITLLTVAGGLSGEMRRAGDEASFKDITNQQSPHFAVFHLHKTDSKPCFNLMRWLREFHPDIPSLVISRHRQHLYKCIRLGARSFLESFDLNHLVTAMAEVHARGNALPQNLTNALSHQVQTFVTVPRRHSQWAALTRREKSILFLKKNDLTHENIAAELGISLKTLQNQISQILKKLDQKSLQDACNRLPSQYFEREGFEIA